MFTYKIDNAVVAEYPPREHRRASNTNGSKASVHDDQRSTTTKHLPRSGSACSWQQNIY